MPKFSFSFTNHSFSCEDNYRLLIKMIVLKIKLHLTIDFIMSFATTNRMLVTIHRILVLEYFNPIFSCFLTFLL